MSGDMWTDPPRPQDAPSEAEHAGWPLAQEYDDEQQDDDLPWDEDDNAFADEEEQQDRDDYSPGDRPSYHEADVDDPAYDDFAGEPDHVRGDA